MATKTSRAKFAQARIIKIKQIKSNKNWEHLDITIRKPQRGHQTEKDKVHQSNIQTTSPLCTNNKIIFFNQLHEKNQTVRQIWNNQAYNRKQSKLYRTHIVVLGKTEVIRPDDTWAAGMFTMCKWFTCIFFNVIARSIDSIWYIIEGTKEKEYKVSMEMGDITISQSSGGSSTKELSWPIHHSEQIKKSKYKKTKYSWSLLPH